MKDESKKQYPKLTEETKERKLDEELKKGINIKRPILKAIRLKCLDCCNGSSNEVKLCQCKDSCFLYPYRMGKNPFNKRELTEEQREKLRQRFKKNMENK